MYYIVGLGNPGKQYEGTRHNIGRTIVSTVMKSLGAEWDLSKSLSAYSARGVLAGQDVESILPETFMNKSGDAVAKLFKNTNDTPASSLVVVYDDVDLALGEIKISFGKGAGGHNGIKSIIERLGTKDFARVRVGVAGKSFWTGKTVRPAGGHEMSSHVLGKFTRGEQKKVAEVTEVVEKALESILTEGVEQAMNKFN